VKLEEFQSSLSAVRTMCHPVRTPICLLFHPSGRQTDKHHLSGRCVIPSGCPSVYCSIRQEDVSFRPDVRQTSIICPDDVFLPSGHLHRIEKLLCQLALSGRSSTFGRLSVLERFTDSFQVQEREDQSTVRTRISIRQESQFKINHPDI
jgi:hypothetical protein